MPISSPRSLAVAAGRALSMALTAVAFAPSALCSAASAQTAFEWAAPVDGLWSSAMNWSPMGSPGQISSMDTVTLGLMGPYTVTLDVNRTIDSLTISNPEAVFLLRSSTSISLDGVTNSGTIVVNDQSTSGTSTLTLRDQATLGGDIILNSPSAAAVTRALINGPFSAGQVGIIGADAVVSGTGTFQGNIENRGLISADGPGTAIAISSTTNQTGMGTITADNGGEIQGSGMITGGSIMIGSAGTMGGSNSIEMADISFVAGALVTGGRTIGSSMLSGTATLASSGSLNLETGNMYSGTIVVNDQTTSGTSTLTLRDGASLGGNVVLNAPSTATINRALINGPFGAGQMGIIGADAVVSGIGFFQGNIDNQGLIVADGPGSAIAISSTTTQTGMGMITADNGGEIQGSGMITGGSIMIGATGTMGGSNSIAMADIAFVDGARITGNRTIGSSMLSGTATLASSGSLNLETGNTYSGTLVVNDQSTTGSSTLTLRDGATLGGNVVLNAPSAATVTRAIISGPFSSGQMGIIGADAVVSGIGFMQGIIENRGLITADGPGSAIAISSTTTQTGMGMITADNGGEIQGSGMITGGSIMIGATGTMGGSNSIAMADISFVDGALVTGGRTIGSSMLSGTATLASSGSLNLETGNTYTGTIVVNDQSTSGTSTITIQDGATLGGNVVLNAPSAALVTRAIIGGPFGAGQSGIIGADAVVSGTGFMQGILENQGLISADGTDEVISISTSGPLVSTNTLQAIHGGRLRLNTGLDGGDLIGDLDSRIDSGGAGLTNVTLIGDLVLESSTSLTLGSGNTYTGTIVVNDQSTSGTSTITIQDGATLGGNVVLNAPSAALVTRAIIGGPFGAGQVGIIGADAVVSGTGFMQGILPEIRGTIRPGTSTNPDTIAFSLTGGTTFTDTTNLQIGFAGVDAGEFGRITNTGPLHLDGTLRVTALGGFEPLSTNEIEIISGGTITGTFDTIEYTGNLEPGDVARVFYENNRVVFAVTCNADVTLPAGVLNILDVVAFINNWNAMGPGSDFNEDGQINILDVVSFISLWNVGCPE